MRSDERIRDESALTLEYASEVGRLLDDGLLLANGEGMILTVNSAAVRLLGENVVGKNITEVVERDEATEKLTRSANDDIDQEFIFQPKSAVRLEFKVRIKELANGFILVLLMDMTLQRNLEKVRRDFVANVSHELRSPLTSLAGFIETILDNNIQDQETLLRFLKIMDEEAKRMSRLIDDLLSLSRVEVDEHIVPSETVPLMEVVRSVIHSLDDRARRREMQIDLVDDRSPGSPNIFMYGYADEINEVFHNLLENAIKYGAGASPITVHVATQRDDQVIISVSNFGDQIAEKHLPRLTERFYRVDKARSRQIGGTGLGLAIVKHIVNRHRGILSVKSLAGGKTTFTVELPIIDASQQPDAP